MVAQTNFIPPDNYYYLILLLSILNFQTSRVYTRKIHHPKNFDQSNPFDPLYRRAKFPLLSFIRLLRFECDVSLCLICKKRRIFMIIKFNYASIRFVLGKILWNDNLVLIFKPTILNRRSKIFPSVQEWKKFYATQWIDNLRNLYF